MGPIHILPELAEITFTSSHRCELYIAYTTITINLTLILIYSTNCFTSSPVYIVLFLMYQKLYRFMNFRNKRKANTIKSKQSPSQNSQLRFTDSTCNKVNEKTMLSIIYNICSTSSLALISSNKFMLLIIFYCIHFFSSDFLLYTTFILNKTNIYKQSLWLDK
jgi:hypothetical protein